MYTKRSWRHVLTETKLKLHETPLEKNATLQLFYGKIRFRRRYIGGERVLRQFKFVRITVNL